MSDRNFWKCLSVQEFLNQGNWQGDPLKQSFEPRESETSWLCLTVQEFLTQSNWQGNPLVKRGRNQKRVAISLTMPVKEFFQGFIWESTGAIATVPSVKPTPKSAPSRDQDMTITDLFDLF